MRSFCFFICTFLFLPLLISAQAPQLINYQGVARDNAGNVLSNQAIALRITIRDGSPTGPLRYMEDHAVSTNEFGLFTLQIGNGTPVLVALFTDLDWKEDQYWLQVAMDATGGTDFQTLGTSQMVSVPYALYAESSGTSLDDAYNADGLGNGRIIEAFSGSVKIEGTDGLLITGTQGSGADIEVAGAGTRMFFNPKKSAFRAGTVSGTEWDEGSVGEYSTSTGFRNEASGIYSVALGEQCNATGEAAVALGSETRAQGQHAVALGYFTFAGGNASVAIGSAANAGGDEAVALGSNSSASGDRSFAVGLAAQAMGLNSVALGDQPISSGSNSFAFGKSSEASAGNAYAIGNTAVASATHAIAIGNGAEASGSHAIAFGRSSEAIGSNSFAHGQGARAFGNSCIAIGAGAEAYVGTSVAIGPGATAENNDAMALGVNADSEGEWATAIGYSTNAIGELSFAAGSNSEASSQGEFVVGQFNTTYTPVSATTWEALDRQFVVGNGSGSGNLSDAMVILKNGHTGISISNPLAMLHVADGDVIFDRNADGSAGTRKLTLSGKRSGNGSSYAGIEFRNEDGVIEYLGSAIRSFNSNSLETGDLRMYVRDDASNPMTEALRLTHEGDAYLPDSDGGVIMKSPDGNCWKLTVSNAGAPVFTSVTCP